jgi:hypothetical protein
VKRKVIIGSVALGLAAGAILFAVLSRRAPVPTPPDTAFEEVGPVAHAFGRPCGGILSAATPATPAMPRKRPADALEATIAAVAAGRCQELSAHFTDQWAVEPFYRQWHGQLPIGAVRVAEPDEVDAGGENGNVVPVTIWIAGAEGVAGLRGEAGFAKGPDGVRIRKLRLEPLPLKVLTWAEAAARVEAARNAAQAKSVTTRPQKLEAPFYGTFYLAVGQQHYTVDASTGKVAEAE